MIGKIGLMKFAMVFMKFYEGRGYFYNSERDCGKEWETLIEQVQRNED